MLNGDFHQNTRGSKATDSREIWILIPGAARPTAPATQQPRLSLSAEPLCRESDTTVGATVSIVTARFRTPMRGSVRIMTLQSTRCSYLSAPGRLFRRPFSIPCGCRDDELSAVCWRRLFFLSTDSCTYRRIRALQTTACKNCNVKSIITLSRPIGFAY